MLDTVKSIFRKKRKLHAIMVDEVGTLAIYKKKYEKNTFTHKDGFNSDPETYIVDHRFTVYNKKTNLPMALYFKGNPQPQPLNHERHEQVGSVALKKILDNKAIEDLFSNQGLGTLFWVLVICAVNVLISIIIICIQTGVIKVAKASAGAGA